MFPQIHQGVMNSWHILNRLLQEEEIVKHSNGWNPLSSKPEIKKINEWHNKKREASKEEAPITSTIKAQSKKPPHEVKKSKKNNWRKPYSLSYRIPRIQKDGINNVSNMASTLMELQGKEGKRMRQLSFPKE
ncbi:hypothetical protein O181_019182 [Austropuccinia psidii MF-1]|uniref:Uncharacterized protein n=1 Tax=Austropuccinia psidii MF-1 TaxID=1389203 RepID=A0A9Q3C981_9BASI|nr:hypothetical protein [Austropuccinia psidii MF-1]